MGRSILLGASAVLLLSAEPVRAWPTDPAVNLLVSGTFNPLPDEGTVPDGSGSAIITWSNGPNFSSSDLYVQHLLASGIVDPAWQRPAP